MSTSQDLWMVECLESQQFLSVSAVAPDAAVAAPLGQVTVLAAPAIPSILGKYTGTVSISTPLGIPITKPATLNITSQTGGKIKGQLSVPGIPTLNFSVAGTVDSKGNVKASGSRSGLTGTLNGKYMKPKLTGTIKVTGAASVNGSFSFTRTKA